MPSAAASTRSRLPTSARPAGRALRPRHEGRLLDRQRRGCCRRRDPGRVARSADRDRQRRGRAPALAAPRHRGDRRRRGRGRESSPPRLAAGPDRAAPGRIPLARRLAARPRDRRRLGTRRSRRQGRRGDGGRRRLRHRPPAPRCARARPRRRARSHSSHHTGERRAGKRCSRTRARLAGGRLEDRALGRDRVRCRRAPRPEWSSAPPVRWRSPARAYARTCGSPRSASRRAWWRSRSARPSCCPPWYAGGAGAPADARSAARGSAEALRGEPPLGHRRRPLEPHQRVLPAVVGVEEVAAAVKPAFSKARIERGCGHRDRRRRHGWSVGRRRRRDERANRLGPEAAPDQTRARR